jgi:uncharacterized protein (DUF427 family)
MRAPGPDHPIRIERDPRRLRVIFGETVVAETSHALSLREATYPAIAYIPRVDAKMSLFEPSKKVTHCPYKGNASYFSLVANGARAQDAVWCYVDPYPAVAEIAGCLAFYPQHVRIEEVR